MTNTSDSRSGCKWWPHSYSAAVPVCHLSDKATIRWALTLTNHSESKARMPAPLHQIICGFAAQITIIILGELFNTGSIDLRSKAVSNSFVNCATKIQLCLRIVKHVNLERTPWAMSNRPHHRGLIPLVLTQHTAWTPGHQGTEYLVQIRPLSTFVQCGVLNDVDKFYKRTVV